MQAPRRSLLYLVFRLMVIVLSASALTSCFPVSPDRTATVSNPTVSAYKNNPQKLIPNRSAPQMGNGEAYNGPILAGSSIPTAPSRNQLQTGDIEAATSTCYQHLIHAVLIKYFRGDVRWNAARTHWTAAILRSSLREGIQTVRLEGNTVIETLRGTPFSVEWAIVPGRSLSAPNWTAFPTLSLSITEGTEKRFKSDPQMKLMFRGGLPTYFFTLVNPIEPKSLQLISRGDSTPDVKEVWLSLTNHEFQIVSYEEEGTRGILTLPIGETARCLQFSLASQFEKRLQRYERSSE